MHIMFNRVENTVPACGQRNTLYEGGTMAGQREHLFASKNRLYWPVKSARRCRRQRRMRPYGLLAAKPATNERTDNAYVIFIHAKNSRNISLLPGHKLSRIIRC